MRPLGRMAAIRPVGNLDGPRLQEAIDAVCGEGRWMSTRRFEPTPAWMHALQAPACPHHRLLVAVDKGAIVGWCRLFPQTGCNAPCGTGELGIGLLQEYRGHGLGKEFLGEVLGWAAERAFELITLTTRADNARAIRLFAECGFTQTNHRENGWLDMVHRVPDWGG